MGSEIEMLAQVAQARNMSIDERRHCCVTFEIIRMEKKPVVSVTYENKRILIKNNLPFYLKCVLRLSCVVHGPIYGRFMGFCLNGFLSKQKVYLYIERKPFT